MQTNQVNVTTPTTPPGLTLPSLNFRVNPQTSGTSPSLPTPPLLIAGLRLADPNVIRTGPPPIPMYVKDIDRVLPATPKNSISMEKATELFQFFQSKTCNPNDMKADCIPFSFLRDGCYARSDAMMMEMKKLGLPATEIYVKGSTNLRIEPTETTSWKSFRYHVAPVVWITGANGKPELHVMDPSLSDKPVPVNQFLDKLGVPPDEREDYVQYESYVVKPETLKHQLEILREPQFSSN
jgi:hypothetical protein